MTKPLPAPLSALVLALLAVPLLAQGAHAQSCLERRYDDLARVHTDKGLYVKPLLANYYTTIGEADLRNSSGTRLNSLRTVLQQDRANVNRFGIRDYAIVADMDSTGTLQEYKIYDDEDEFFSSRENRALFAQMKLLPLCDENGHPIYGQNAKGLQEMADWIVNARVPGSVNVLVFPLPDGTLGFALDIAG